MDRDVSLDTLEAPATTPISIRTEIRSPRTAMLEQIAVALGISLDAFAGAEGSQEERTRILTENTEALTIFAGMTNPDARQRGLAYLRWIAEQGSLR